MTRTLITLSGSSKTGKTNMLKKLISIIIDRYNINEENVKYMDNGTKDKVVKILNVGLNKKSIGINTGGDNEHYVKKTIELFDKYECDIVVCPTKSNIQKSNGSITLIQNYYKNKKDSITLIPLFKLLQKGKDEDENKDNDEMMVEIIMNQLKQYV